MAANSFVAEERQAIAAGKQLMQVSVAAFEIRGRKRRSKHDSHDAALYQREGNDISLFQLRPSAAAAMLGPEEPRSVGTTSDGARACWLCVLVSSDMSSAARPGLFQLLLWSNSWGKSWPGTDRGSGSVMWSRTAAQTETEPRVSSEWRDETMQPSRTGLSGSLSTKTSVYIMSIKKIFLYVTGTWGLVSRRQVISTDYLFLPHWFIYSNVPRMWLNNSRLTPFF